MAIGVLGIAFGYFARESGLTAAQAVVMSATTFAGSPQFASVSVYSHGGTLLGAVLAAALLASRFASMSASAAPSLPGRLWQRLIVAQLVVDETWAVAYRPGASFDGRILIGAGVTLYVVHVIATIIGAIAGNLIADPRALGVDAMAPALFVILLAPHLTDRRGWTIAGVSAVVTLSAVPLLPSGIPLMLGAAASVAVGIYMPASEPATPREDGLA
jgi:predicted branched-subunit amino acid permease